ncbi:MAG: RimK family alpha-L-glutamate ligase [Gammaproteobacteria bacterium]
MHDPRVVIFTDDPGWHGRALTRAFAARGLAAVYRSLKDCRFDLATGAPRIVIDGFDGALPRGVFVRGVPGGTLEEITLRLDFLHCLALSGVTVFNSGHAIERTVDKAMTSFRLAHRGLPTPRTWVCESAEVAQRIAAPLFEAGVALVVKPLFGSQGEGIQRAENAAELTAVVPAGGVFYLQEYLSRGGPPFRDWRVLVIDGVARFVMERISAHWITNRAQGARCVGAMLDPVLASLAEAAATAVDVDYAGVDLMHDAAGRWCVGEVNGVPAWWGLAQATGQDVTGALVEAFCRRLTR